MVNQLQNTDSMPRPVPGRFSLRLKLSAPVADKHQLVLPPNRLDAQVVVDAAVGKNEFLGERLRVQRTS